jgi:hypothetical protein
MAVYLFLPIRASDLAERAQTISAALASIRHAIQHLLQCQPMPLKVHAHLNGPASITQKTYWVNHFISMFHPFAVVTSSPTPNKIACVNYGLSEARKAGSTHFIVIDDDVVFASRTLKRLVDIHTCLDVDAVCSWKYPLIVSESSDFERLFGYATLVNLRLNIYRAPTGSIYCVDPHRVREFPATCNEGDYLTTLKNFLCDDVSVGSRSSFTLRREIQRRKRINAFSRAIGYQRPHHDPEVLQDLTRHFVLPTWVSPEKFWRSRELTDHVMKSARL